MFCWNTRWLTWHLACHTNRIHQPNIWIVSKHIVIAVLSINQFKLVELHIFCSLLYGCFLFQYLFLQGLNQLGIFWPAWSILIHLLKIVEFIVEFSVFLVKQVTCLCKFLLESIHLLTLLLYQVIHLLT